MRVPTGVNERDFASALAEFEQTVGKQWVFTSDEDLDLYRDAYSPFLHEPEERIASAAVAPSSTEEVQQIVRTANRYRVPLYAISTGKNLGYGGSAPAYSGCVVVDLKRMNRIIEVNEEEPPASSRRPIVLEPKLKLPTACHTQLPPDRVTFAVAPGPLVCTLRAPADVS